MCDKSEFVEAFVRRHYSTELLDVDANCIRLINGTEIFTYSLYVELDRTCDAQWASVVEHWFSMLDLIRARIADTG